MTQTGRGPHFRYQDPLSKIKQQSNCAGDKSPLLLKTTIKSVMTLCDNKFRLPGKFRGKMGVTLFVSFSCGGYGRCRGEVVVPDCYLPIMKILTSMVHVQGWQVSHRRVAKNCFESTMWTPCQKDLNTLWDDVC